MFVRKTYFLLLQPHICFLAFFCSLSVCEAPPHAFHPPTCKPIVTWWGLSPSPMRFHWARPLDTTIPPVGLVVSWSWPVWVIWCHGHWVSWSCSVLVLSCVSRSLGVLVYSCQGLTVSWSFGFSVFWCFGDLVYWFFGLVLFACQLHFASSAVVPALLVSSSYAVVWIWSHGHLVSWSFGVLVSCSLALLVFWSVTFLVPMCCVLLFSWSFGIQVWRYHELCVSRVLGVFVFWCFVLLTS